MKTIKQLMLVVLFTVVYSITNAQCLVPTGLAGTSLSSTSTQLNWNVPGGATSYNLEVQNGQNTPTPFLVTANTITNTYTVNGLTGGLAYKFKVRTRCGGSKSNWSAWFTFVAGGGAINCVPLTGLAVSNITASGATFNWNGSSGGLGTGIRVEDASGNPVNFLFNASTISNTYNMTGLSASSNYKVKIRKRCAVGINGTWSPWVFFSTTALRLGSPNSEPSNDTRVTLYPNPASDFITINLNGSEEELIQSIQVYDITGKLIKSEKIDLDNQNVNLTLDTHDINSGIYQLRIQTSAQVISKKIVISR